MFINSFISWIGGKKALRNVIYRLFPKDYGRYIEVFGGGGWVLFGKKPDQNAMEVYNDFNSNLANLFYCVKTRTWEFLRHLGFLPINSRVEFHVIRKFIEKEEFTEEYLSEELELTRHNLSPPEFEDMKELMLENAKKSDVRRAAAFYKLIRYSYGSGCTSYSCQPCDVRKTFFLIWEASRRLSDTVVENKDFEALIRQYDRDNAFFYCDPPYYETEGHYAGFHILSVTRINNLAQRYDGGCEYPELIITNYDPKERRNAEPKQLNLFSDENGGDEDEWYRTNEMG
jgi:DNA adenine methylase